MHRTHDPVPRNELLRRPPNAGFRAWGLGVRARDWGQGIGFSVEGSGFRIKGLGCRVRVKGLGFGVWGLGVRVLGFRV